MDRRVALLVVLGLHLAVGIAHGTTHALVPVALPAWLNVLVFGMVFVGPVVGVGLMMRGHPLGIPLFTITMAGSFLLGGVLHFLVENADHVASIPAGQWQLPFQVTAAGVTIIPAIGTALGLRYWLASPGRIVGFPF